MVLEPYEKGADGAGNTNDQFRFKIINAPAFAHVPGAIRSKAPKNRSAHLQAVYGP